MKDHESQEVRYVTPLEPCLKSYGRFSVGVLGETVTKQALDDDCHVGILLVFTGGRPWCGNLNERLTTRKLLDKIGNLCNELNQGWNCRSSKSLVSS